MSNPKIVEEFGDTLTPIEKNFVTYLVEECDILPSVAKKILREAGNTIGAIQYQNGYCKGSENCKSFEKVFNKIGGSN